MVNMRGYGIVDVKKGGWLEKEKPVAGPLDAIVRPIAIAPCSSDTHMLHSTGAPGLILGHESVGEVVEVGSMVKNFKSGDIVVVPCTTPDWLGKGMQQRNGNNAHDNGLMGSFKFLGSRDGVFAEFYLVNQADANMVLKPDNVSVDAALMTVDMMSTGFYGVEMANVQFGDTVVVFGIGPVGLMAVAGAALRGAGRIIAIGTRPNCIELAKEYGATDIVSYKEGDIVKQILALNGGQVDCVIIAGGNAGSMNQALSICKPNGTISNVNYYDVTEKFDIPLYLWGLGMSDVTIRGGFCPGGASRIEKMLNLIATGRVHPEKLLNYQFEGFDKIEDAFKLMDEKPRDLIKPVVHISWN